MSTSNFSNFSNYIHINTLALTEEEKTQVQTLGLTFFDNGDWWQQASSINFSLREGDILNPFIKNISICTQSPETIQILFIHNQVDENTFEAIHRTFEIPRNEVLSFQDVMILGLHNTEDTEDNLHIDMTITNAAIEEEGRKRGKTPVWETLFSIVLPFIPDISSLDPFIPDQPDIPDYSGLIGGISELVQNNIPGVIPINNLLEVAPQELEGICDSYLEYKDNIIQSEDEYPTDDATQGYNKDYWDDKNGLNNGGV